MASKQSLRLDRWYSRRPLLEVLRDEVRHRGFSSLDAWAQAAGCSRRAVRKLLRGRLTPYDPLGCTPRQVEQLLTCLIPPSHRLRVWRGLERIAAARARGLLSQPAGRVSAVDEEVSNDAVRGDPGGSEGDSTVRG